MPEDMTISAAAAGFWVATQNPARTILLLKNVTSCYIAWNLRYKGYKGKRLYLQKIHEENDPELVQSIRRRKRYDQEGEAVSGSSAVYFKLVKTRPLVGD